MHFSSELYCRLSSKSPFSYRSYQRMGVTFDSHTTAAINALFQRPWFSRLWIRQEIQLASLDSVLLCGKDEIAWYAFRRAIYMIECYNPLLHQARRLNSQIYSLGTNWQGFDFTEILRNVSVTQCSDPRDFIYGLLAVSPAPLADRINISYTSSAADVFRSAFLADLGHSSKIRSLELICLASQQEARPVFSLAGYYSQFAAGHSIACFSQVVAGQGLRLKGCHVSTVMSIHEISPLLDDIVSNLRALYRSRVVVRSALNPVVPDSANNLALTLCLGRCHEERPGHNHPTVEGWRTVFDEDGEITSQVRNMLEDTTSLSLVEFADGRYGLVPPSTVPGDVLFVLLGCDHPFILRPRASGNFDVVGPCYIHDLANGEALLEPLPSEWEPIGLRISDHANMWHFRNKISGRITFEDPRLGPLSSDWEYCEDVEEGRVWPYYRNLDTDEQLPRLADPRMLPTALEARGVKLQDLRI